MKVTIITCFESNEERVSFVLDACKKRKYDVKVLTTDFSHIKKCKRNNIPIGYEAVETKPYSSNMSIARLFSHKKFAEDAFKKAREDKPQLLWIMAPCLSLIKEANNYRKENPNVKIIIDIIDMWPESLPIGSLKNTFPFKLWKNIRTRNINFADEVVTECNYYHKILSKEYKGKLSTIYWARDGKAIKNDLDLSNEKLSLCYIGSINNIIDIDLMKNIINKMNKAVDLYIIGDGENKDNMINSLNEVCNVVYHGAVYDEKEKEEIFNKCHAGFNLYKEGLYIGLTVKCMDYFKYGLPIINNIKGDTWNFVLNDDVGININNESIIDLDKLINMRKDNQNIIDLYNMNFTKEIFEDKCLDVIDRVLNK